MTREIEAAPLAVETLDTPCVTIDLDRLAANIARGQRLVDAAGMRNRPHIKTHKIPAIAAMQIEAGAAGITCQKVGEAEVFAASGVADDILITFNIVGDAKVGRLMDLAEAVPRLSVVADNEIVLDGLSAGARRRGRELPVLVECDTGFGRNGVQTPAQALELARAAERLPGLRFAGLMVFPNTAPRHARLLHRGGPRLRRRRRAARGPLRRRQPRRSSPSPTTR